MFGMDPCSGSFLDTDYKQVLLLCYLVCSRWKSDKWKYTTNVLYAHLKKEKRKHLICWSVPLTGTSIQQRSAHSGKSHSCEALQQIVNSDETAEDDLRAKNEFQIFGQTFSNLSLTF